MAALRQLAQWLVVAGKNQWPPAAAGHRNSVAVTRLVPTTHGNCICDDELDGRGQVRKPKALTQNLGR